MFADCGALVEHAREQVLRVASSDEMHDGWRVSNAPAWLHVQSIHALLDGARLPSSLAAALNARTDTEQRLRLPRIMRLQNVADQPRALANLALLFRNRPKRSVCALTTLTGLEDIGVCKWSSPITFVAFELKTFVIL
jgi:hypothetical protein